jgi:methylenetetrahydrofolate dehydrogenase (NADP+)/methenyltetrahydrofolate cyclohydrolase
MNFDLEYNTTPKGTNLIDGAKAREDLIAYIQSQYDLRNCYIQLHLIDPYYQTARTDASIVSINQKDMLVTRIGAKVERYHHSSNTPVNDIEQIILDGNSRHNVFGIIVQMPIDPQFSHIPDIIAPSKDLDSLNSSNTIWTSGATAEAAIRILIAKRNQLPNIAIVGAAGFIARDIIHGLQVNNLGDGNPVFIDITDPIDLVRSSQTIISAVGKPGLIRGTHLSHMPFLGIDIGNTRIQGAFQGDFHFPSVDGNVEYLTPVPGGMGPLEMVMLAERIVRRAADPNFFIIFNIQ